MLKGYRYKTLKIALGVIGVGLLLSSNVFIDGANIPHYPFRALGGVICLVVHAILREQKPPGR